MGVHEKMQILLVDSCGGCRPSHACRRHPMSNLHTQADARGSMERMAMPLACSGSTAGASASPPGAGPGPGRTPSDGGCAPPPSAPPLALSSEPGRTNAAIVLLDSFDQSANAKYHAGHSSRMTARKLDHNMLSSATSLICVSRTGLDMRNVLRREGHVPAFVQQHMHDSWIRDLIAASQHPI